MKSKIFKNLLKSINLKNKTAIITGAGGKLGKRIAQVLGELNSNLILIDHPNVKIDYKNNKISIKTYKCNFENIENVHNTITKIKSLNKKINILINNAFYTGVSKLDNWLVEFNRQDLVNWDNTIKVGLTSAFELSKSFADNLGKNRGLIINIGSIYANNAPNKNIYVGTKLNSPAAYSVAKAGLLNFTKWLAINLAPKVRVNMISPGGIKRSQSKKFIKQYLRNVPLNRLAYESDIDGALIYLSTDLSNYVTGHNLLIDGGYSAS